MAQNEQASSKEESQQSNNQNEKKIQSQKKGYRRYIGWTVLAIILLVGGYYGYHEISFIENHVDTDDAQTTGFINPVLPRVMGYVSKVLVNDNEHVHKGQLLVEIDSTEFVLKVNKAQTALQNARANLDVAKSNLQTAKVSYDKAQTDYNRAKSLYQGGATTKQKYQDMQAAYNKAQTNLETARKQVNEAKTTISQQKNALDYAQLQLSYTKIKAPSSGVVSKKDVQVGQLVQSGQPLMSITDEKDAWVVANFKETQLKFIKIGQNVKISVDAYPDKKFSGTVQSIAGGTGAEYSLLPPDNATGNFVKVVQRVPVKIILNDKQNPIDALPLGLNVETTININQKVKSNDVQAVNP